MPVCPVCNGLASVQKICPRCGRMMFDAGLLQDYYDNYSAYLEQDLYEDGYRCYNHATFTFRPVIMTSMSPSRGWLADFCQNNRKF